MTDDRRISIRPQVLEGPPAATRGPSQRRFRALSQDVHGTRELIPSPRSQTGSTPEAGPVCPEQAPRGRAGDTSRSTAALGVPLDTAGDPRRAEHPTEFDAPSPELAFRRAAYELRAAQGEEALRQEYLSLFRNPGNRGRYTFGKTEIEHLRRRYRDPKIPLFLRLVDYTKVHAMYPSGEWASPLLTHTPESGELARALCGHSTANNASKRKSLQRALRTAQRCGMLTSDSTLQRLELPTGEWSKRSSKFRGGD